jgi:hypothetical protein
MRAARVLFASLLFSACGAPQAPPPAPAARAAASGADAPPPAPAPKAPPPEPPKAEAEAPKAPEPVPPSVKLLAAGASPKRALRYKFKAGVTEYLAMDLKMAMTMSIGDKVAPRAGLPTVRTTMKIDATELTPEGDLRCAFAAEKIEVLKDTPLDPKAREAFEGELAGLVGMRGKARVSPRGVATEADFELPPGASPKLRSQMDSMRDAIRQMYVPFPEEEVGRGAKWEVTSRVPLSGALMDTKLVYTLTRAGPDGASADVETSLSASPNQPMQVAELPPGASATLESLSGKGAGKASPSFARLVGTGSNKLSMDFAFNVALRGEKMPMRMQSDVAVSSRPGRAPAKR